MRPDVEHGSPRQKTADDRSRKQVYSLGTTSMNIKQSPIIKLSDIQSEHATDLNVNGKRSGKCSSIIH